MTPNTVRAELVEALFVLNGGKTGQPFDKLRANGVEMDLPAFIDNADPDHPGWRDWRLSDDRRFNAQAIGKLLIRQDGPGHARVRMFPEIRHSNLVDALHGGATLGFIDVALFGAARVFGLVDAGVAVTLDLSAQFIGAGRIDEPLDAKVELLRETRRLLFMRGLVVQGADDSHLVASFAGTIRKASKS
jgi:acyl-coenzyme A thioesterase PaaI-like protein